MLILRKRHIFFVRRVVLVFLYVCSVDNGWKKRSRKAGGTHKTKKKRIVGSWEHNKSVFKIKKFCLRIFFQEKLKKGIWLDRKVFGDDEALVVMSMIVMMIMIFLSATLCLSCVCQAIKSLFIKSSPSSRIFVKIKSFFCF